MARQVEAEPSALPVPPAIQPDLFRNESPTFLRPEFPPRPSQADERLTQALARFDRGKQLYETGDLAGARREFDAAMDLVLGSREPSSHPERHARRVDELISAIHRIDVEGLGAGAADQEPRFDKSPLEDLLELTFPIDPSLKNKVKEELAATASQLPLELSDAVLSYINYFSTERGKKILQFGLRRAGRYKPMISRVLDEEGLPQELVFLAQAESGFLPRAVSRMRAAGMWQFVRSRGNEYNLKQTPYTDDRFDPELATRAAARHLRDLYQQFGDWYLAIAAYNCGPVTVERAVQRTGHADVWELRNRRVLPLETSNYVPIILAMTIMSKNAKDYGLDDVAPDPPLEYDTIELTALTNISLIADSSGLTVSEVRELNPALLKNLAPAGYRLHVPKGSAQAVAAAVESVPLSKRMAWRVHRVSPGETLPVIARRYGATPAAIASANTGLNGDLEAGDMLIIPAAYKPEPAAKKPVKRAPAKARPVAKKQVASTPAKPAAKVTSSTKPPARKRPA